MTLYARGWIIAMDPLKNEMAIVREAMQSGIGCCEGDAPEGFNGVSVELLVVGMGWHLCCTFA